MTTNIHATDVSAVAVGGMCSPGSWKYRDVFSDRLIRDVRLAAQCAAGVTGAGRTHPPDSRRQPLT